MTSKNQLAEPLLRSLTGVVKECSHGVQRTHTKAGRPLNRIEPGFFRSQMFRTAPLLNKPRAPLQNTFLAWLLNAGWPSLAAVALATFLFFAIPLGLSLQVCGCKQEGDSPLRLLVITFSGLCGMDIGDILADDTQCLLLVGLVNFCSQVLQGTTFAVICTKLLSPRTNLLFSKSCCAYTRDEKLVLTFRVCHPQGHYCCINDVSCAWMHGEETSEGEKYVAVTPVEFKFPSHMFTPVTVTHTVDESSPFWAYREDLCETWGQVRINVSGLDKALETDFCDAWVSRGAARARSTWL